MTNKTYIKSKEDYHNIIIGDLCEVVERDALFIKVVKVGMSQVHYLYNFEFDDVEPTREEIWEAFMTPLVYLLAATDSVSAGRSYNDLLMSIDGGEMPTFEAMEHRGELAPNTLQNEFFKLLGDVGADEDMIDSLLDGHMHKFTNNLFVSAFYRVKYTELAHMTKHWEHYGKFIRDSRAAYNGE